MQLDLILVKFEQMIEAEKDYANWQIRGVKSAITMFSTNDNFLCDLKEYVGEDIKFHFIAPFFFAEVL